MFRSQRILLKPTVAQERLFRGSAGLSRFTWNWAVAICKRHYEMFGRGPGGKTKKGYKRPSAYTMMKHWNKVKYRRFKWATNYSKVIADTSFTLVDRAYQSAFAKLKKTGRWNPPKFHKKGSSESFQVVQAHQFAMTRYGSRFVIPRIAKKKGGIDGRVKCVTPLRWPDAKQVSGRVKKIAGRWWLTLAYELPDPPKLPQGRPTCGIDLGCTTFATIASGGEVVEEVKPPKPYAKAKRRLKRLQRQMSRRKKGSNRRRKARLVFGVAYKRTADIRRDFLHKLTTKIVKTFGRVVLEDLSVKGMANGSLASTIGDIGMHAFRRQIEYKALTAGTIVVVANRYFPSSKTCFKCGVIKEALPLSERVFTCECGHTDSRDGNAAKNLEQYPEAPGNLRTGESGVQAKRKRKAVAARKTAKAERTVNSAATDDN